ncbi:MAG: mechanosensitive ion channel family protein [Planctomycetota bacterium]
MLNRVFVVCAVVAAFLLSPAAIGQDADGAAPTPALEAPAEPWAAPIPELRAELRPLRLEALGERAELWMTVYQGAVARTAELGLRGAEGAQELAQAAGRKTEIQVRFEVVLNAIDAKGGDTAEYRDFIDATSSVDVDLLDPEAAGTFAVEWLQSPEGGIAVGLAILKFIVIIVIARIIAGILAGVAKSAVKRLPKASSLLQDFVVAMVRRIVMIIGIVVAIGALGVNIGPLVAAIGAAGLVIGLALQGTLSNFASGLLILIYRPYDVGDVIDGGGVLGKVEAMNLVSTRIATFDNQVMFVPNNSIWNGVIKNITARDTRRVDLTFGIGYSDDMAKAEGIIMEVLNGHDKVLKDPAPVVKVHELADSSVNFVVRPWSAAADYWDVYWDITRRVKERFDAESVGIPFPQRDLHIPGGIEVTVKNG